MSLRLVPKSVTFSDLEHLRGVRVPYRCVHDKALYKSTFTFTFTLNGVMALILHYFTEFGSYAYLVIHCIVLSPCHP